MRTGGILLIAAGAVLIYWVLRAGLKSELSSSGSSSSAGDGSGEKSSGSSSGSWDSGSHMAIDTSGLATGTMGSVYTVNSTYAAASDQARDDMNAYAHAMNG